MSEPSAPVVSIIVVDYREPALTGDCIASIRTLDYPADSVEVILVENAVQDESCQRLAAQFPGLKIIANPRNVGFARAVNQGIRAARADSSYTALVNNDSVLNTRWLRALVCTMEENPRAGCCGAQEESYGNKVSIQRLAFEGNWMGGGSVIYRKAALDDVGLFDEYYFAYCEDIDISWRLKLRGWGIVCCKDALWFHHGAGRTLSSADRRLYLSLRNRLYLLLKFGSLPQILKSLARYSRNVLLGRNRSSSGAMAQTQTAATREGKTMKMWYACLACCDVAAHLPVILVKRASIYRGLKVQRGAIDEWIRANDAYVTLNF
jgi:GT2 family glycosyltransferase